MKRLLWLLILAVTTMVAIQAQTPARPVLDFQFSVMATDRLRDFAYVQLKPEALGKLRPTAADFDILPLRVNSHGRSDLYRYTGPGPLRFVKTKGQGESIAVDRVLATVDSPASRGRSLFIIYPGEGDNVSVLTMDDEPSAFPERHARLLNLAGEPIAVSFNGQTVQLTAAARLESPRSVDRSLKLGVAMSRQGRPVPVFDQSLTVSEDERLLIVFLPPFRAGADVRTRVVRDSIAPANAPVPAATP